MANPEPTSGQPDEFPPLTQLAPGASGVIVQVDAESGIGRRLLDLGFIPATAIRVVRRAPLGDPIVYELRGTRICLRRDEAAHIRVRPDAAGARR